MSVVRVFATVLTVVFAIVGALPLALGVVVRTQAAQRFAADKAAELLRDELGLQARFKAALRPWPLALVASDVVIESTDGSEPAVTIERLEVRPRLFSLLQGIFSAGDIEIDRPSIALRLQDGQLANLSIRTPTSSQPQSKRAPFSSIAVNDGRVHLIIDGHDVQVRELDVDVMADEGPSFDIALRAGSVLGERTQPLSYTGYEPPPPVDAAKHEDAICQLDVRARVEPSRLIVRRLRLMGSADLDPGPGTRPPCDLPDDDLRKVQLELRHAAALFDAEGLRKAQGRVRARAPLRLANQWMVFLPLHGWLDADLEGNWERGAPLPDIRGSLDGKGIALGIYRIAEHLNGTVRLERGVVRVPDLQVGFADGIVRIRDVEVRPLEPGMPLQATAVTIDDMQFTGLMRDLGVTDHTHVKMHFDDGTFASVRGTLDPVHIDSDLLTHVRDFEVFDSAFDDPARKHVIGVRQATVRSIFAVRPDSVQFQNARAEFGKSSLQLFTSLGFANEFRLSVASGSRIELADINPIVDIPWAGTAKVKVDITGVFDEPTIKGELSIDRFMFADLVLGDVKKAKVTFVPLVLDISELAAVKDGSAYDVPTMRVDFNGPAAVRAEAQIQSSAFDVRDFFAVFGLDRDPRFEDYAGKAQAQAKFRYEQGGPRDRCGSGWMLVQASAKLHKAELLGERFDGGDLQLDYEWVDPAAKELGVRADVRSFTLRKGPGVIVGSANIEPGGILRAVAAASRVPVSRIDALGSVAPLLDAELSASAQVRGTVDRMEADIEARLSPLRIGMAELPASHATIHMQPVDPPVRVVGRTKCNQPISAPFDLADYQKDRPDGLFMVEGELFGGQIRLQDVQVTKQRNQVVTGTVQARALDIGKLAQVLPTFAQQQKPPQGKLSGVLTMQHFEPNAPERADVTVALERMELKAEQGSVRLREGTPPLVLQRDELSVPGMLLDFESARGVKGTFVVGGQVHQVTTGAQLELSAKLMPTDLSVLSNVFEGVERASGLVQANLDITGSVLSPGYAGSVTLRDGSLLLRTLPAAIDNINVDVRVGQDEIRLENASARMGGGTVHARATLPVRGFDFGTATATIAARNLALPVAEDVNMAVNADLIATWNAQLDAEERPIPRVVGDVSILSFEYARPITVRADINSLTQRVKRTHVDLYDPDDDIVDFEVSVRAHRPLRLRNNLADMMFTIDSGALTVTGTNQRVGMRGGLRVRPGGRLRLRNNEFEVREGLVRFDDPNRIEPMVDVTAVTEYRRYSQAQAATASTATASSGSSSSGVSRAGGYWRIQLRAHGDADNLRLDLTSEPALSQEDILLLLTLGVTQAELDQMQASSIGESAAVEALSTLTGADTAVRDNIPVIDDFRFGSSYSSRSGRTEPNVTVGKRVTDRVRANVTSGLSDSREVRSNIEWQLTGQTSVLGSYDNVNNVSNSWVGNLGADIRFRITFE